MTRTAIKACLDCGCTQLQNEQCHSYYCFDCKAWKQNNAIDRCRFCRHEWDVSEMVIADCGEGVAPDFVCPWCANAIKAVIGKPWEAALKPSWYFKTPTPKEVREMLDKGQEQPKKSVEQQIREDLARGMMQREDIPLDVTEEEIEGAEQYISIPTKKYARKMPCRFKVQTLEGEMIGEQGDYLVQGVEGELYPCKGEIFEKTYSKVIP